MKRIILLLTHQIPKRLAEIIDGSCFHIHWVGFLGCPSALPENDCETQEKEKARHEQVPLVFHLLHCFLFTQIFERFEVFEELFWATDQNEVSPNVWRICRKYWWKLSEKLLIVLTLRVIQSRLLSTERTDFRLIKWEKDWEWVKFLTVDTWMMFRIWTRGEFWWKWEKWNKDIQLKREVNLFNYEDGKRMWEEWVVDRGWMRK